jgi:phosphoserine phosphatase
MKEMTVRQNMIQEILANAVGKHRRLGADEICTNKGIDFGKFTKEIVEPILWRRSKIKIRHSILGQYIRRK